MNKMSKVVLLIILTSMLLVTGCAEPSGAQVGGPAPDFQLKNINGQSISLSGFRGKPVLINFWATWCPFCRDEMPYLQQVYEEWSGKGLVVLAINIGESPSEVKKFLQTHNLSLPVLLDTNEKVAQKYNVPPIPTTFFINSDGIIQQKIIGAFPNKEAIEKHLNAIMP